MNKFILLIMLTAFSLYADAQSHLFYANFINSLAEDDQQQCKKVTELENSNAPAAAIQLATKELQLTFEKNYRAILPLFNQHGYPDRGKVGYNATHNFWIIVQHMDSFPGFQQQVLDSMSARMKDSTIDLLDWAYLTDRVNINLGLEQVYGTQLQLNSESTSYVLKPTGDTASLNLRRKDVGLPPVEQYIEIMNRIHKGKLKN